MAFVPQGQQSFGTMTVDENLHVVADRYGSEAKARYDEAVTMFPVLKEFAVERADRYYVLASGRFIATGEGGPAQRGHARIIALSKLADTRLFSSVNRYTCEF